LAGTHKKTIIKDNKGKVGIYRWTNLLSGKSYVGSSADLGRRFSQYLSKGYDALATKKH
jgi:hypothetical protein